MNQAPHGPRMVAETQGTGAIAGPLPTSLKRKLDLIRRQIALEIKRGYTKTARALAKQQYERLLNEHFEATH